jgi:hypothetical protein
MSTSATLSLGDVARSGRWSRLAGPRAACAIPHRRRAVLVGPGRLDQLGAQVLVAGLGDVPRRVEPPEEYSEGTRPVNPMNVAARGNPPVGDLAAQGQRAQRAHATVGGQPVHRVGERFPVRPSLQVSLDRSQRRVPIGQNRTVMLERGPQRGFAETQCSQPLLVQTRPRCPAA